MIKTILWKRHVASMASCKTRNHVIMCEENILTYLERTSRFYHLQCLQEDKNPLAAECCKSVVLKSRLLIKGCHLKNYFEKIFKKLLSKVTSRECTSWPKVFPWAFPFFFYSFLFIFYFWLYKMVFNAWDRGQIGIKPATKHTKS